MPSEYTPDLWTLLEITSPAGERHFRVLASWVGGYLGSDSWKMSSGITRIEECEGEYRVHNESGSVYFCRKGVQGMSGFASAVLAGYQDRARAAGAAIKQLGNVADVAVPFERAPKQGCRDRMASEPGDLKEPSRSDDGGAESRRSRQ